MWDRVVNSHLQIMLVSDPIMEHTEKKLHMMTLICVTDISLGQSEGSLQPPGTQAGPHRDSTQVQVRCISHQECGALRAGSHSSRPVTIHCPVLTLPDCSSGKVPESTTPKFGAKFLAVILSRACVGHTLVRRRFTCCQKHQAIKYVCKSHWVNPPCLQQGCWIACSSSYHTQP